MNTSLLKRGSYGEAEKLSGSYKPERVEHCIKEDTLGLRRRKWVGSHCGHTVGDCGNCLDMWERRKTQRGLPAMLMESLVGSARTGAASMIQISKAQNTSKFESF